MEDSKKLKGKDLINIGIFAAIYFVVIMALAMLGFIPIFMPTYSVLMPLLGGIVFMLFLTKVKKFWNGMDYDYHYGYSYVAYRHVLLRTCYWNSYRSYCRIDFEKRRI